jgi:hypothetical protein
MSEGLVKKIYTDTLDRLYVVNVDAPFASGSAYCAFWNLLQIGWKGSAECRELSQKRASAERGRQLVLAEFMSQPSA